MKHWHAKLKKVGIAYSTQYYGTEYDISGVQTIIYCNFRKKEVLSYFVY